MSDMPAADRSKAAMRQTETPLNKGPGQVVRSPSQCSESGATKATYAKSHPNPYQKR